MPSRHEGTWGTMADKPERDPKYDSLPRLMFEKPDPLAHSLDRWNVVEYEVVEGGLGELNILASNLTREEADILKEEMATPDMKTLVMNDNSLSMLLRDLRM